MKLHPKDLEAERAAQRDLLTQAPVGIAILEGARHVFTFANPAYRALVNGRDVVGKTLLEALPDLEGQGFDKLLDRVLTTGEPFSGKEVCVKLADHAADEALYINFTYTPKHDADGAIDGVMVCASDVTEQVRSRQRVEALAGVMRESEDELRQVADALPVLVAFVGPDERYRFLNRAYEEWFGVSRDALTGMTLRELIGDAAYATLKPFVDRGLAGEQLSFETNDLPYRLGGVRDIKVTFVPNRDAKGDPSGFVSLVEDRTVARRAELALLEQSRKAAEAEGVLRELVDNLPDLAWSAEPNGHIDFYNQRWFDFTGTTMAEMEGWGWQKVHDPAILPAVMERWGASLVRGEPFEMEFPLRRADGVFRWYLTRVQPLRAHNGAVLRWFGVNVDIHEQRETTRLAEEASRAKDEFLAMASHELRTPLNAILGWARILRADHGSPSSNARGLEIIERNALAQVRLIEDILDGSRIISGKLHLEIGPVDLTGLVRAALDAVRPAAEAKTIRLTTSLDPDAARFVGDAERLQQVIWNLANNAVKFTPKGGSVDVSLARSETHIELAVVDTGQGIAPEFLPHVFERFRQAEGSTSRRHGGLGLGLALVRHLVEAHGGTVHADSGGVGCGSRFLVRLPVQAVYQMAETVEMAPSTRPPVASVDPASSTLAGMTILVVDDERDARDLLAVVLRAHGAEVATAASAAQALEQVAERAPTVLISDIGMPEVDGYELIRRVRALDRGRQTPIVGIALTAYARQQDRQLALDAGFQTHLTKPVDPDELIRVVDGVVRATADGTERAVPKHDTDRADTFSKLTRILTDQGVHDALRFLNSRTPHRFTALYRFDPPTLRNVMLFDSESPSVTKGDDAPMDETYCSIVADQRSAFATADAGSDDRLRSHPARATVLSYSGVLLSDLDGKPFGTLCHFDLVACEIPARELPLMEAVAPLLMKEIALAEARLDS